MKKPLPSAAAVAGARKPASGPRPAGTRAAGSAAKPQGKPASRTKREAGAAVAAPVGKPKLSKRPKPGKTSKKLEVRLLVDDLARLDTLKQRAAAAGRRSKRAELLRAGLVLLQGLDPLSLCDVLEALPVRRKGKSLPLPSLITGGGKTTKR